MSNKRVWMKNAIKNPSVEITIADVKRNMTAEVVKSEDIRQMVEKLYKKKYRITSRLLRLARKGSSVFELK